MQPAPPVPGRKQPLAAIEIALRDSEARYRQLVQALPVAFYATDAHGRVTLYNAAAAALLGRAPVVGERLAPDAWKLYRVDGTPLPLAPAGGEEPAGIEAIVERADGSLRNVIAYPQVFRDADGGVHGAINAMVDITERKSAEHALAAAKDDLARQVAELKRLHARLSDADRRKDVFLATLAHELRNPLTPIRNAMHVIRLAGDNHAAVARTRGMVERQLAQLVRLVDDLLDVSRISRSKIELKRERIELQAVVRQALETSAALVDHYGHRLEVAMPATPVFVDADPARLAQVFSNLVNNAAKYTPPGGRLRVSVVSEGDEATVAVRDNGIGLPPEMLASVFEMFTQLDTGLDRSRGGLGVGLAIVKRLVEMHGGRVVARSDGPDTGSEFSVSLPLAADEHTGLAPAAEELPALRRETAGAARRILVVDDNVDLATSLALMLTMLGHEVKAVHDGPAAIAAVEGFAPDLVFLDIGMPRMSGYETCRHIRALPGGAAPVVIALSGWGQDHDKRRSQEAGMDLHLVKPFDPEKLQALLGTLGARAPAAGQPLKVPASRAAKAPLDSEELATDAGEPGEPDDASPATEAEAGVEAARYALYRRILPVLRHGLAGELQSIQFAVNLARYSRERGAGDLGEAIERIADQAHAAIGRGHAITEWLRPDPSARTTVGEAVHACLDLVGTEWSLRGIEVNAAVPAADEIVYAAVFRELLAALLVTLGDAAQGAADVTLTARKRGRLVMVSLRARAATRNGEGARVSLYRDLRWSDVGALARAHGVRWARRGDHVLACIPLA